MRSWCARLRLLVRAVCLFAVGGLVQLVSSPVAVILEYYAVLLVLCVPLLRWRPRRLLLLAAVLALVVPSLWVRLAGRGPLERLLSWTAGRAVRP